MLSVILTNSFIIYRYPLLCPLDISSSSSIVILIIHHLIPTAWQCLQCHVSKGYVRKEGMAKQPLRQRLRPAHLQVEATTMSTSKVEDKATNNHHPKTK